MPIKLNKHILLMIKHQMKILKILMKNNMQQIEILNLLVHTFILSFFGKDYFIYLFVHCQTQWLRQNDETCKIIVYANTLIGYVRSIIKSWKWLFFGMTTHDPIIYALENRSHSSQYTVNSWHLYINRLKKMCLNWTTYRIWQNCSICHTNGIIC